MSSIERDDVLAQLVVNARLASQKYRKEIEDLEPVTSGGTAFLPGYAPYIGSDYFEDRTQGRRVLFYALSQNLHDGYGPAATWASDWAIGLDRQNHAFTQNGTAAMHPFDTGHIPVLASLIRSQLSGRLPGPAESIYPEVAATNLSKFSFRSPDKKQTTDNVNSLRRCWKWFSQLEVELLRPDFIVCCDARVHRIVRESLGDRHGTIRVPFPSLRVINRHYRKPLRQSRLSAKQISRRIAACDKDRSVAHRHTLDGIVNRDGYYFAKVDRRMAPELMGNPTRGMI